tara:strand:+ start:700 stop:861 length:162 start_codon:yes stop_codon:yes gene_type:complete
MREKNKILLIQFVVGTLLSLALALMLQAIFFGIESLNFQLDIIKAVADILWDI